MTYCLEVIKNICSLQDSCRILCFLYLMCHPALNCTISSHESMVDRPHVARFTKPLLETKGNLGKRQHTDFNRRDPSRDKVSELSGYLETVQTPTFCVHGRRRPRTRVRVARSARWIRGPRRRRRRVTVLTRTRVDGGLREPRVSVRRRRRRRRNRNRRSLDSRR